MPGEISLGDIKALVGQEVGISRWIDIPQSRIDMFADATDDHQFIHVDPQKAAETPFGGTIAHGFLTLSMLSAMNYDCLPRVREQTMGINYGFDKLRFIAPVPAGSRIRCRFKLSEARLRGSSLMETCYDVTIEIEGSAKPALTASWRTIIQFDPKDRPEE